MTITTELTIGTSEERLRGAVSLEGQTGLAGSATTTVILNVSALRDLDTTLFTSVSTLGYASSGDGGQGDYWFTQMETPPTDNGFTVMRSNDGRGYWSLSHSGTVNIKQAGARASVDCADALTRAVAAIVASNGGIAKLVFPPVVGGYKFASQVLLNASQITYELFADLINTNASYITPFVFAHDLNAQPLAALFNVSIVGNGHYIDGNGAVILAALGYGPGILPPTFPHAMFNYVDNLRLCDTIFQNGVYDSCAVRQCRNHSIKKCTFKGATQYLANGLNITSNWAAYVRGDYSTYSHGIVENCVMYNNASMGATYYHCAGGKFKSCISYSNGFNNGAGGSGSGFSYESPPGSVSTEYADGRFEDCHANNNGINGYYINTPGIVIDDSCTSYGNGVLGLANDVSGLQMCGVVVVGADAVTVKGTHEGNARHGVTFLGAPGLAPCWKVGGVYMNNAGCGINIQGLYRCDIEPGTKLIRNGRTLIASTFSSALNVSNSAYNLSAGMFSVDGVQFDSNGGRDIDIGNVGVVVVRNCLSYNNNDLRGSVGGTGYGFGSISTLYLQNNFQDISGNGWTTNAYVISSNVLKAYVYGNKSNQGAGNVMINNAGTRFGISGATKMTAGTHAVLNALPATGTATLANVTDVLATLLVAQQDGLMQS
jgi:hypothetical protein